jgi:hypothetical protein
MHAAVKIIIGLILILLGLGLFLDSPGIGFWESITNIDWIGSFMTVLFGVIPILLILLGLFVVWLEADELKMENEIEEEPEKPKKKK